jgi:hypothetical protein
MIVSKRRALYLMASLMVVCASAQADDARSVEIARRTFETGMDQYRSGDLEGARISLAQSYDAWPSVETLRNLAITELNTDHVLDALKHFKLYARDKNADPEFVNTKLRRFLDRCERAVGHLRVRAPPDSRVSVDGHSVEDWSEAIDVLPGPHTIGLTAGNKSDERGVDVLATRTVEVNFLGPGPPAAAPPETTMVRSPVWTQRLEGEEAVRSTPGKSLATFWTARNTWLVSLVAAAAATAGVGIGFGVAADNGRSAIDDMRASKDSSFCTSPANADYCNRLRSAIDAQQRDATVSNVAFGVAGALAAGAVVLWGVWPKAQPGQAAQWWVGPSVGGGSGALTASGRF